MSSLVYLVVWSLPPHIQNISSPNQYLLFATHAHTVATCFAVVSRLYHLFLVFFSQLISWNSIFYLNLTSLSDHFDVIKLYHICNLPNYMVFSLGHMLVC